MQKRIQALFHVAWSFHAISYGFHSVCSTRCLDQVRPPFSICRWWYMVCNHTHSMPIGMAMGSYLFPHRMNVPSQPHVYPLVATSTASFESGSFHQLPSHLDHPLAYVGLYYNLHAQTHVKGQGLEPWRQWRSRTRSRALGLPLHVYWPEESRRMGSKLTCFLFLPICCRASSNNYKFSHVSITG